MLGMILCGGPGKRFRPLTETTPKALFELKGGYTIMDRQLSQYKGAGFDRVILLTAHLGEKIRKKFGKEHMGLKLEYVHEDKPLGTLNAIRLGMEAVGEDVVVSNGDVVTDINLKRMREEFERSGRQASIFVVRMPSPYGIIELGGGRIKSFKEKPLLNCYINAGFYCFSERVLKLLEEYKTGNVENTAFPELAARQQLGYYKEEGDPFWISIDTTKDLETVRKEYLNRTDKPWGYEKSIKRDDGRLEKLIFVMAGHHATFDRGQGKTLNVLTGAGWVEPEENKRQRFAKGSRIQIKSDEIHGIMAARNTLLRET